jgi:hypothetical protein
MYRSILELGLATEKRTFSAFIFFKKDLDQDHHSGEGTNLLFTNELTAVKFIQQTLALMLFFWRQQRLILNWDCSSAEAEH